MFTDGRVSWVLVRTGVHLGVHSPRTV